MIGNRVHRTISGSDAEHRLLWPETGGMKVLLEIALTYYLVVIATPVLVEQVSLLNPTIVPEPFTTALFAVVWFGIGTLVVWLVVTESLVTLHRFEEPDAVVEHIERGLPTRRQLLLNGGVAVFGGAIASITYERFLAVFVHVIDLLVIVAEEFVWTITIVDGLYVACFLGGFLLFARGVDRLFVGGIRTYLKYHYESRTE